MPMLIHRLLARFFPYFIIFGCEGSGTADVAYMIRYTLFSCAWFSVKLHVFYRDDHDVMHDHPWSFWSLILWNGYIEDTPKRSVKYYPLRLLWRPARTVHRVRLFRGPAVTLVVAGPKKRPWFFHPLGKTPIFWKDYFKREGC